MVVGIYIYHQASAGVRESVIITTPEKLDGLMRNIDPEDIKEMFERADLFIFDECQNVGSGKRGVTLELLIERVRFLKPDAAILGTAAFFTNIHHFSEWLGDGSSIMWTIGGLQGGRSLLGLKIMVCTSTGDGWSKGTPGLVMIPVT